MPFVAASSLVVLLGLAPLPDASQPLTIRIATASDALISSCKSEAVEKRLAEHLSKDRIFHVATGDGPTDLKAEIVKCVVASRKKAISNIQGTPLKLPTGGFGVMTGGEQDYDIHTETTWRVVLRVRLTAGERSLALVSDPIDDRLSQATKTVGDAIEQAVKEKRGWLLGVSE